jgi:hypothetical protein
VARWTFTEVGTASPATYTVELNPMDGGSPARTRNVYVANTGGPGGSPIVQGGRLEVQYINFSGWILSQAMYQAFDTWAKKNTVIEIVDDLNRQFIGQFVEFSPQRIRSAPMPWRHSYTAKFVVGGLVPQGATGNSTTRVYFAKDDFARTAGGTIASSLGIEPLSSQTWQNNTAFTTASNQLVFSGGVGYVFRTDSVSPCDWYATSGVPVITTGDVIVSMQVTFTQLTSGTVGIYARNGLPNPTVSGNATAINGGGYLLEIQPSSGKMFLSRFGVLQIASAPLPAMVANDVWVLAMRCNGTKIACYFYKYAGANYDPTYAGSRIPSKPIITVTDTAYANPGYAGMATFGHQSAALKMRYFNVRSI